MTDGSQQQQAELQVGEGHFDESCHPAGIPALLQLTEGEAPLPEQALAVLKDLAFTHEYRTKIAQCGGIPAFVAALEKAGPDSSVGLHAAACLRSLSLEPELAANVSHHIIPF